MTALSAPYGPGVHVICDSCGEMANADGHDLHDADLVYVAVAGIGWTGSAFARGPHRCPACSGQVRPAPRQQVRAPGGGAVADRIQVRYTGSACVVRVSGDIDANVAAELRAGLEAVLSAYPTVVIDLGDAGRIDSAGLGALVRARNEARRRHGEVLLAEPSRFVQAVLRTMRLHTAFRVFGSVEQAIMASCQTAVSIAGAPGGVGPFRN